MSYGLLKDDGYKHGTVRHVVKEWASYDYEIDVVHHTNNVEGCWYLFKASVREAHIHVSQKYRQRYLSEFTFRSNHRHMQNAMLDLLIGTV